MWRADHIRGDREFEDAVSIVHYGDYLCPYCRALRPILAQTAREARRPVRLCVPAFSERARPSGALFTARAAEAAGKQGRFWEMHDRLYAHEPH